MAPFARQQMSSSPVSKRVALSYIVDWVVIIAIAAIGAGFWKISPNHRPFSPVDPSLSFPYVDHPKIPSWLLVVIALIIPGVLTAVAAFVLTPGPTARETSTRNRWAWKLWEFNTAWMGLGLGLATTFLFTEGMKVSFGKPRPDLLARCSLDPTRIGEFALGGFQTRLPEYNVLVSWEICDQADKSVIRDGFQSFPSGHASFSFSGMTYLSLYLLAKFSISIPYLLPNAPSSSLTPSWTGAGSLRKSAASPPLPQTVLSLLPLAIATYVASTRFSDFRHHGFDILFGSIMGFTFSYLSFRFYHAPLGRGAGWTWAPRSASRAFWAGVGKGGYVVAEAGHGGVEAKKSDLEDGVGAQEAGKFGMDGHGSDGRNGTVGEGPSLNHGVRI